jgi:DNA-directed RNA polymerase
MVHDSYATHAADADTLAAALRDTFVQQYQEHDVLAVFRAQLAAQLKPELAAQLPPVPASGNLDLQLVKSSVYFFA